MVERVGTVEDLVAMKKGRLGTGGVFHRACGGRLIYTFIRDAYLCQGCQAQWDHPKIIKENRDWTRDRKLLGYTYSGPELDVEE